jgi:hypothetical protein
LLEAVVMAVDVEVNTMCLHEEIELYHAVFSW